MTIQKQNYLGCASDYSEKDVWFARRRSMEALMTMYDNPAPRLRMERFNQNGYYSSWEVKGGMIAEANCDNIFSLNVPVCCGEVNKPETDFVVVQKQYANLTC